jgi:hypothetical protein
MGYLDGVSIGKHEYDGVSAVNQLLSATPIIQSSIPFPDIQNTKQTPQSSSPIAILRSQL